MLLCVAVCVAVCVVVCAAGKEEVATGKFVVYVIQCVACVAGRTPAYVLQCVL